MLEDEKTMKYLEEMEENAEKILTNKRDLINLDRIRNDNRVAIRQLGNTQESKTWLAMGNILFRFNTSDAKQFLEDEQATVEKTIENTKNDTRLKVHRLREVEGKPELKGFTLKPLENDEIKVIYDTYKK